MYRRPKFLEILHQIREEMSREADYDVDLFAEMVRSSKSKRQNVAINSDDDFRSQAVESLIEENQSGKLKIWDLGIETDKSNI
jgi:hypothetical protein